MGAKEVNLGIITQGAVVALINYMSQILVEMIKLANLIITINKAVASGNRIGKVFEISPSIISPQLHVKQNEETPKREVKTEKTNHHVTFNDVVFRYKDASADSLTQISFNANRGETIGIIGGTGSGKTTLINLIPRFYDSTAGDIIVDGKNVKDYKLKELREKIGIVPQSAVLFQGTIRENLQWGKADATEEEMYTALEQAQAMDFVKKERRKLDFYIQQGGKNLSGGQRQRISIARALIRQPEVLILDDSSSALDYATDARLRKAIGNLNKDMTTFIVSQRAASILSADKIIVLHDGKMVGYAPHKDLIENCDIYQEIYYSQFTKEAVNE